MIAKLCHFQRDLHPLIVIDGYISLILLEKVCINPNNADILLCLQESKTGQKMGENGTKSTI